MSTATFTEQGHIYERDGVIVPSVTQVLTLAGITDLGGIPEHILERARIVGSAVHEATQFLDEGDLDLESLDPSVVPFVVAYQRFKEEQHFEPKLIEHRMVAESHGMAFGMCFDRLGRMDGYEMDVLLDIKTSSRPNASWAIQTAAYAEGYGKDVGRLVVHVAKDGSYKLIPYIQESDFQVWNGALTVAHWKLGHGAKLK